MKRAPGTAALALLLLGCGGTVVTGAGGSGTGASGTTLGTTSSGTGPQSPCPATQPSGGACSAPEGFRCTYGDAVRAYCRSATVCTQGQWTATTSACAQSTVCGQLTSPPAGQVCTAEGAFCPIGDTLCACSQCLQGPCMAPPTVWQCAGPPTTPGCPAVVPNDGAWTRRASSAPTASSAEARARRSAAPAGSGSGT